MAPDELGRRVHHHVGAVLEGAAEVRSGQGRVDDQRYALGVSRFGQGGQVCHHPRWVGHDLGVEGFGLGAGGGRERGRVVRRDKRRLDPEPAQA